MLTDRTNLVVIICLVLCMASTLGCASIQQIEEVAGDTQEQLPIRRLRITIDPSQREELFDQLRNFADNHAFKFETTDYGTGGERFLVEMLGDNIKILVVDVLNAPSNVRIRFYDQTGANSVSEETIKTIDVLVSDLKSFISEIPNVTITEDQ